MCRGCDGVPNSGKVYDTCGVCGGNGTCVGATTQLPIYVDYLLDVTDNSHVLTQTFATTVSTFCTAVRYADSNGASRCVLEDYLASKRLGWVESVQDLYDYATANGRLGEIGFTMKGNAPEELSFMTYRVLSSYYRDEEPQRIFRLYQWLQKFMIQGYREELANVGVTAMVTSSSFQPAAAVVLSKQSLWFAVGIGAGVAFVFVLVYFVSLTAAVGATLVAVTVCFGTLTVCTFFPSWQLDAILQVCVSCTIPIGLEYVVHLSSGYFDYLQTTTSHLFAREVSRRTAVQGAMLRSLPAICTSVFCVVVCSIMFDVSPLIPSQRSGQVCITMHLLVVIAVLLFSGAMAALGPMKAYQHWTLSAALCVGCAVLAVVAVLLIFAAGGVTAPTGNDILTH